jgi:hypothetical protein
MNRYSRCVSPSMVVACMALFVALGGTGYAASQVVTRSAKQQKKAKIKRGPRGRVGPQGPAGPAGATGPAGPTGLANVTRVVANFTIAPAASGSSTGRATCPPGQKVLGGGTSNAADPNAVSVKASYPEAGDTWRVDMNNSTSGSGVATVYAICANAS